MLVVAGLGNLILVQGDPGRPGLDRWQMQVSVLTCSALIVLVGTVASVSVIGGLITDLRLWLIGTALALITGVELMA